MKRPIPKKKIGIVHLEMVKESRSLYGMKRMGTPGGGSGNGAPFGRTCRPGNAAGIVVRHPAGANGNGDCSGRRVIQLPG